MKRLLILILVVQSIFSYGQIISYRDWERQAKMDKRLLPKYGHLQKTEKEIESDDQFISSIMSLDIYKGDSAYRKASNDLIFKGFNEMYTGSLKTAMYRFNQAFLLDSSNTNIYWGYGAIYMNLGEFELAKKQYEEGLNIDSTNDNLLTDFATYYMEQYLVIIEMPENDYIKNPKEQAMLYSDTAIALLITSYNINPKNQSTVYKLSCYYWYRSDCDNAWKYYDLCMDLGGQLITEEFKKDLKKKCKRKK